MSRAIILIRPISDQDERFSEIFAGPRNAAGKSFRDF